LYILYKRRSQKQKRRYEIEKKEITERTIFESEEKAKFDLSDYIHTTLAGDVRNVSEIIKESPIEEQSKVNILTRTSEILKKVRSISHELGPGSLKTGGLKDGLFDMCAEIQDIYKIRVNYVCKVDERFEANFELKVYRIIQDLKNNILAHSKATEADFQILKSNNKLSITVEDNGIGFDSKDPKYKKGLGVRNIEAKVGNLNGNVEFSSMPGDGTCVLIEIPLPLR
jgi:signal transduction histidine kinase